MDKTKRSFFRHHFQCSFDNFTKESLVKPTILKLNVDVVPFSEKLELKFLSRQKQVEGKKLVDFGVIIQTNIKKSQRETSFSAKFSIVLSDGTMHYCSEATQHHLSDESRNNIWKLIVNTDEIFANDKKFMVNNMLKINIELQINAKPRFWKFLRHPALKSYENLVNNPLFSDFKITCSDGKTIYAHKCILMAFENDSTQDVKPSQFFRSMIESQMNESKTGEMQVTDIDSNIMLEIMRFIYTGQVNLLRRKSCDLLIVADKYDIVKLKKVCVEVLEHQLTEENVIQLLKLAYLLNLDRLKENCINYVKFSFESISKSSDYKELSADILRDIIVSMSAEPLRQKFDFKLTKIATSESNAFNFRFYDPLLNPPYNPLLAQRPLAERSIVIRDFDAEFGHLLR